MLLNEILNSQSIEDWFVDSMITLYRTAYDRATSTMNNTGDFMAAKRVGGATIGRWYSENIISGGRYDLQSLIASLRLPPTALPRLLGKRADKEAMGYSSSGNMAIVISTVISQLRKRGKPQLADRLSRIIPEYQQLLSQLKNDDVEDLKANKPVSVKNPTVSTQQQTAVSLVMDVISNLPKNIQHDVRTEVARRGNTLQALQQVLTSRGISV